MVNANELRIGNWINVDSDTDHTMLPDLVTDLMNDGRCYLKTWLNIAINPERIEGIPLTPEIFAGFDFAENFHCWYRDGKIYIEQYSEGQEELKHIKYVHQIQNLHFALTGTELNLDL